MPGLSRQLRRGLALRLFVCWRRLWPLLWRGVAAVFLMPFGVGLNLRTPRHLVLRARHQALRLSCKLWGGRMALHLGATHHQCPAGRMRFVARVPFHPRLRPPRTIRPGQPIMVSPSSAVRTCPGCRRSGLSVRDLKRTFLRSGCGRTLPSLRSTLGPGRHSRKESRNEASRPRDAFISVVTAVRDGGSVGHEGEEGWG